MSIKTLVMAWIRRLLIDSPDVACRLVEKDVMQKNVFACPKSVWDQCCTIRGQNQILHVETVDFFSGEQKMQINSSKAEGENSFENCILLV